MRITKLIVGVFAAVFFLVGLGLLGFGINAALETRAFLAAAQSAPGTVAEFEHEVLPPDDKGRRFDSYRPIVTFTLPDGQTERFVGRVGSGEPAYAVGEAVEVLYVPDQPGQTRISSFSELWLPAVAMGGFGCVFTLLPTLIFVGARYQRARIRRLMHSGRRIEATILGVTRDIVAADNASREHPATAWYHINAEWRDPMSGETHQFSGSPLIADPGPHLPASGHVVVYLDPANVRRYHMDQSFLPNG